MENHKKSFVLYTEWGKAFSSLSHEDAGKLICAIFHFIETEEEPKDLNPIVKIAFSFIKAQLVRDSEKYESTLQQRKNAARKSAENRRKAMRTLNERTLTSVDERTRTLTDNVDDNVDVNDNVDVDENVNDKNKESISNDIPKKKVSLQQSLEGRRLLFLETIKPFVDTYGNKLCNEFFAYWTEPNKSNTKMKFELEKTWDIQRRIMRWANSKFSNK